MFKPRPPAESKDARFRGSPNSNNPKSRFVQGLADASSSEKLAPFEGTAVDDEQQHKSGGGVASGRRPSPYSRVQLPSPTAPGRQQQQQQHGGPADSPARFRASSLGQESLISLSPPTAPSVANAKTSLGQFSSPSHRADNKHSSNAAYEAELDALLGELQHGAEPQPQPQDHLFSSAIGHFGSLDGNLIPPAAPLSFSPSPFSPERTKEADLLYEKFGISTTLFDGNGANEEHKEADDDWDAEDAAPSSSSSSSSSSSHAPDSASKPYHYVNPITFLSTAYIGGGAESKAQSQASSAGGSEAASENPSKQFQNINVVRGGKQEAKEDAPSGSGTGTGSGSGGCAAPNFTDARCVQLVVGGSSSQRGIRSSAFSRCLCNNMLCLQCNFSVQCFPNARWAADVDYMFLRNNAPNERALSTRLDPVPSFCAYNCQCAWLDVAEEAALSSISGKQGLLWACAGHRVELPPPSGGK